MRRRTFIAAAATALATPTAASADGFVPGHGVSRAEAILPPEYAPEDAVPFYHPVSKLRPRDVDWGIRDAVMEINRSGWVWTLESCEGHPELHVWSHHPLIRVAVHDGFAARMLGLWHRSVPIGQHGYQPQAAYQALLYRHRPPPMPGWFEARLLVRGPDLATSRQAFARFARAVNESRE